jgi:hypothetical protein
MTESPIAPALDSVPLALPVAPLHIDLDDELPVAGTFPADHPSWQRDVISMSSRARAVAAALVPLVVRALTFWDHRVRELVFGTRTLGIDPAGCYRLR